MLHCIKDETAWAAEKPTTALPMCRTVLVMTQPEQAAYDMIYMLHCINDETAGSTETIRLRHDLYAALY